MSVCGDETSEAVTWPWADAGRVTAFSGELDEPAQLVGFDGDRLSASWRRKLLLTDSRGGMHGSAPRRTPYYVVWGYGVAAVCRRST